MASQLSKGHRLSFDINTKRASFPLDLILCDLWGPSPIESVDSYRYYVVFVDDFLHLTWFYPLKTKTGFYHVLTVFSKFVQTQFDQKVKVFQNDGGSKFVNQTVQKLFKDNGTFH